MSDSKLFYFVFLFFFSFACSTVSSLTTHKYKCSPQQSRALSLFKHSLFSINNSFDYPPYYTPCQDWLGSAGYHPIMRNWKTNTDCCDWNGVTCDYLSGDVISLDLSCGMLQGNINPNTSLFNLPHLQKLNLAFNDLTGFQSLREIGRFSRSLTHLNISECWFSGQVPTNITLLHNLVSLDLSFNEFSLEPHVFVNVLRNSTSLKQLSLAHVYISSVLPDYFNISSSLKLLNLQNTGLQGKLPNDIFNLQSLEILDLSRNSFTGRIPLEISLLPKLVSLDLSVNHHKLRIEPHIFNKLLNNSTLLRDLSLLYVNISWILPTNAINISSSLKTLDLYHCNLMGSLPKSPLNLTHLTYLDLSFNKLNGTLPSWLFTLPSLETLSLDNNMFSGDVPFNSFALSPLKELFLSHNQLGAQIDQALILQLTNLTCLSLSFNNFSSDWELDTLSSSLTNLVSLSLSYSGLAIRTSNATHYVNPNISWLGLASCKIKEFPKSLRSMRNLRGLDLSNNEISGDIPIWDWEIGHDDGLNYFYHLNLSHNFITGMPQFQFYGLTELYLQSNQIQGTFPPSICNMRYLLSLDLSNNSFAGVIPQCFGDFSSYLEVVDLGNNDFHGTIPNTYEDCGNLQGLILKGNQLQGELPTSLSSCHYLRVLDLGNNHLNDTFPNWLGGLSELQVLNLKSNIFHGRIAVSSAIEFPFPSLRVLDLSYSRFVGEFPRKYFQNFNAMTGGVKRSKKLEYLNMGITHLYYWEHMNMGITHDLYYSGIMTVKGLELPFAKISVDYMIVDLSNNGFEGEIPNIIGNLTSLIVLDVSHNNLIGQIPYALGNLSEIESLDLSCNRLTGEIPQSFGDITNLEFLNLSENNLVGHIPEGKQFSTFDMSSFQGNPKLCGIPLPNKCSAHQHEPQFEDDEENGFTWRVVMMGYGCGTFVGLLMGYLMLSTGRPKWFNAIADAGENLIHTRGTKRRYIYIGK